MSEFLILVLTVIKSKLLYSYTTWFDTFLFTNNKLITVQISKVHVKTVCY